MVIQYGLEQVLIHLDINRFGSHTGNHLFFRTLEGLVSKGVKVDLGIPHELWDKPSAEITQLWLNKFGDFY